MANQHYAKTQQRQQALQFRRLQNPPKNSRSPKIAGKNSKSNNTNVRKPLYHANPRPRIKHHIPTVKPPLQKTDNAQTDTGAPRRKFAHKRDIPRVQQATVKSLKSPKEQKTIESRKPTLSDKEDTIDNQKPVVSDGVTSPINAANTVDDELKDMLFAQHQSGGSIDIIVTSETKADQIVPVTEGDALQ